MIWKITDKRSFFRSGGSDQWRGTMAEADLDEYQRRLRLLASPQLVEWLENANA